MGQTPKFLPSRLLSAVVLVGLEGVVVLSTMTEMAVDQVVVVAGRQRVAKAQQGQVVRQHLDKVMMEDLKLFHNYQEWAEEEVGQLVDRLLEAQRLELLELAAQVVIILELPMLVVVAEDHKAEQEEQAEAEEEEMAEQQHKMVLMARQTWVVVVVAQEVLDKLADLEVAGLS
jgi:hypothetical protein